MADRLNPLSRFVAERILRRVIGKKRDGGKRRVCLKRYGIGVEDPFCRERILGVLRSFFGGFEAAIDPTTADVDSIETLYRPFYHEGAAMGFGAGELLRLRMLRSSVERFESEVVPPADPFVFLRYVGLGFWLGFRLRGNAAAVDKVASRLREQRLRHLVHDGYGFQVGFFEMERPRRLEALRRLHGFGRAAAFNGLGRSLWFFHMDRPEAGFVAARALGDDAAAAIGGMGLAATFTRVDDLSLAYEVAGSLNGIERQFFEKGIRIALYCRHENNPEYLDTCLSRQSEEVQSRARSDLASALVVGEAISAQDDFIEAFHVACGEIRST